MKRDLIERPSFHKVFQLENREQPTEQQKILLAEFETLKDSILEADIFDEINIFLKSEEAIT